MSSVVFPPAFLELLRQILRRAPRLRVARDPESGGRRRALAQSGTFAGHREYGQGEDLRYVDWNAYARTGELFLKVLEEEDRRTLTICLDCTASMATGAPNRFHGALRLAAILGGLALTRLDGVRLVVGRRKSWSLEGAGAVPKLVDVLTALEVGPQDPVDLVRQPLERGWQGGLAWISDFARPDEASPALHLLRRHGRRCTGWLPSLATDAAPRLGGWVRLRDPETGEEQVIEIDAELRQAMAGELERLRRQQQATFAAVGYPLIRFALPAEGDFRLASWFRGPWIRRL